MMFFDDVSGLFRTLAVGVFAYAALILSLRISGKRTLSKWNAFDFVVTIALGSTLATVILSKDVAFAEGIFALGLLIALQFVITWLSVRFDWVERLVKGEPTLLFDKGKFLRDAMERQRVAEDEVRMAIRAQGIAAIEAVEAVVLETDGSFSVIKRSKVESRTALEGLF
ncbi:MAG TPA: YetF domain-containing protein [Pyrinomonadaceae bacterium]